MASTKGSKKSGGRGLAVRGKPSEVNLVSARSGAFSEAQSLSRNLSAGNYAKTRSRRRRNRLVTTVISIVLAAVTLSVSTAFGFYELVLKPRIDNNLTKDFNGNPVDFDGEAYEGVFTPPADPMKPFFMVLLGLDDFNGDTTMIPRTDTIVLLYVDPGQRKVAMISVPRDLKVMIPGYGEDKVNAAYVIGELRHIDFQAGNRLNDASGVALATRTIAEFADIKIAYSAIINFSGLIDLVDSLGGVTVEVPVVINDREAGPSILSPGRQVLNGEQALTFVRSRKFLLHDYQRQANQRTFLQALAAQILSGSPTEIKSAIERITEMTTSNITADELVSLAMAFRGIKEQDIFTYAVPTDSAYIDDISYELVMSNSWRKLITAVAAGEFPDPSEVGLEYILGVTPQSYQQGGALVAHEGILTNEQCAGFVVDVRNGWGIKGAAKDVSDSLALAGYQQGEIANTNTFVYRKTYIIYKEDADLPAANDIAMRLGFGTVMASKGRYNFSGNILVIVGEDFPYNR